MKKKRAIDKSIECKRKKKRGQKKNIEQKKGILVLCNSNSTLDFVLLFLIRQRFFSFLSICSCKKKTKSTKEQEMILS